MMSLFLEPLDVWLFRDGRPFDAQSDHRAASLFPPYPSLLQGVIRSQQLVVQGVDLTDTQAIRQAVGDAEDYGRLRLRGGWIARCGADDSAITRYFALPADLVAHDDRLVTLQPTKVPVGQLCNAVTEWLLVSPVPPQKEMPGEWLAEGELLKYLRGETPSATPSKKLFVRESRLGIGRDDERRVTREAVLYEVEFIRPQPGVGLYVEVEGYDWPETGTLRIGGEGRASLYRKLDRRPEWPLVSLPSPLPPRFKVYFATPACFERGWLPRDWNAFFTAPVELATAALARYESLGGYDWAHNRHKDARRYVPAGSVYYFVNPRGAALRPDLIQNAITDAGAEIGFGQILITEWKE
mgnify:CR=1 FL=1